MSAGSTEGDKFPLRPDFLILLFNKEKKQKQQTMLHKLQQ